MKHGALYERMAERMSDVPNGRYSEPPKYALVAKCHSDEYEDFVGMLVGGARCSGYNVIGGRKVGEAGAYYAVMVPTIQQSPEKFKFVFEADDEIGRFSIGGREVEDTLTLLVYLSVLCQSFGNGDRGGFEEC